MNNNMKKRLPLIITSSVLVFLTVSYVVISSLIGAGVFGSEEQTEKPKPQVLEGESVYNNMAVAYPYVAKSQMISIAVSSHKDSFVMSRPQTDKGYDDYFMFYYGDENGDLSVYYPDIMLEENDVNYKEFYAIEGADGLNIYKIDYVAAAIGALYFDRRIEPEEDREAQLERYGLSPDKREVIYFTYLDENGNEYERSIFVGDRLITGVGFYFMVDGRDYIYASASSQRLEYLLTDFESFLHSRITAAGKPGDGLYEPYLTTDYKQWTNKYYGINSGGLGMYPSAESEVVVYAEITDTVYDSEENDGDGYRRSGYELMSLDLTRLSVRPELSRLLSLLKNTPVGDYSDNEKKATVVTNINEAELRKKYTYEIYKIDGVIDSFGEHSQVGYPISSDSLVKVSYNYRIDGVVASNEPCHAVIDLAKESAIPSFVKEKLISSKVGDGFYGQDTIVFDLVYDENNSVSRSVTFVITDIVMITRLHEDGKISYPEYIDENCVVTYNYKYVIDGYEVGEEGREMVDLSAITEGANLEIKKAILGLKINSSIDLAVYEEKLYCQPFMDFLTYGIKTVKGFVEKVPVVSFEFVNSSQRDPFYAESIYKNTLENENKYFALDALACQNVTFLLGGVGGASNSQVSAGLSGMETVAVGLTPENMDKFGLYDGHTVYFELPRDIASISGTDDFTYVSTLGCNLYISKKNSDGTRYIASSLYGIIVKIEGAQFDYLEKSFEEYWARKNLVMVNYTNIEKMILELNMTDVYGSYQFDLDQRTIYISGNQHFDTPPEGDYSEYNFVTVTTRPLSERLSDTAFSAVLRNEERESITLANLYNRVWGKPMASGHDTLGTANFKSILTLMYGTNYEGSISAEEAEEAKLTSPEIMKVTFYLTNSAYGYTYSFYRISDRRVMVQITRVDKDGNSVDGAGEGMSGFYISSFGAKKIINAFTSLLNGENIDPNAPYWD